MRDEDIAKLMDGVAESGALEAEAKPAVDPVVLARWSSNVRFGSSS